MSAPLAPDRLARAVAYIEEYHELTEPLSAKTARRILVRTNALLEGGAARAPHAALRTAAAQEPEIDDDLRALYRKVVNAYWRFAPARSNAHRA